jgi:hypothetical protein
MPTFIQEGVSFLRAAKATFTVHVSWNIDFTLRKNERGCHYRSGVASLCFVWAHRSGVANLCFVWAYRSGVASLCFVWAHRSGVASFRFVWAHRSGVANLCFVWAHTGTTSFLEEKRLLTEVILVRVSLASNTVFPMGCFHVHEN